MKFLDVVTEYTLEQTFLSCLAFSLCEAGRPSNYKVLSSQPFISKRNKLAEIQK